MKNIPLTAAQAIKRVHMAMLGSAHTFLHIDYLDCDASDEPFGTGDGVTTAFTLKKTYNPGGGATYERDIIRPDVNGDIRIQRDAGVPLVVMVDGTPTSVSFNSTTKQVEFAVAPSLGAERHGLVASTSGALQPRRPAVLDRQRVEHRLHHKRLAGADRRAHR